MHLKNRSNILIGHNQVGFKAKSRVHCMIWLSTVPKLYLKLLVPFSNIGYLDLSLKLIDSKGTVLK